MEDYELNLNPNPDSKPKGKLKFKSSAGSGTGDMGSGTGDMGSGTFGSAPAETSPAGNMGSGTFGEASAETAPAETAPTGGTVFRPRDFSTPEEPAFTGSGTNMGSGTYGGTTFRPADPFGADPRFGDDEEYSDTAKYVGSNEGGYNYGYDRKTPKDTYANRNVQYSAPYGGPNQGPYGGPGAAPYGGPNQGPYGGPNQGPYSGPNQGPYGGPGAAPYGGPGAGPYGGPGNVPYDPVRERMIRERYQEPVQQHYLEDGNDARSALIMGIVSIIASSVGGAIGMIGGLYCSFLVFILPIFGITKAINVIKRDRKLALAYVALGLNCMALTPALIAILVLILTLIAKAIQ